MARFEKADASALAAPSTVTSAGTASLLVIPFGITFPRQSCIQGSSAARLIRRVAMSNVLPKRVLGAQEKQSIRVSPLVIETAGLDAAAVYARLKTRPEGLTSERAAALLAEHGQNILARDQRPGFLRLLWRAVINPLVILLAVLATVSFATGDPRAGTVMVLMIELERRAEAVPGGQGDSAAAKLKAMISVNATVAPRRRAPGDPARRSSFRVTSFSSPPAT